MSASQFYIHLPSDSSLNVYPDNTIAKYSTKLAKTIDLDGQYEVGLSEIIYPTDYYNVDNRDQDYNFRIKQMLFNDNGENIQDVVHYKVQINSDLYYTSGEFLEKINVAINEGVHRFPINIIVSLDNTGRININITRSGSPLSVEVDPGVMAHFYFELSPQFSQRLGFDKTVSLSMDDSSIVRARHKFDLHMGKKLMYVYSDIVSYSLVGDVSVPLLRACNLQEPSSNNTIHLSFPDIHYKPVQKSQFDTIDISINTEEGLLMPFQSGKVMITLHFRKVK